MSRTIRDLRPAGPVPEEVELGPYFLAYSDLESSLRRLVVVAIATTHGYSGDRYSHTSRMVEALTTEMNFAGIEEAIETVIEIRTEASGEELRAELQSEWKRLKKRCVDERRRRNRFAHSSVTIEEDLGGAILVDGKKPKMYSAEELRDRIEAIRDLTRDVQGLASRILMVPFA